MGDPPSLHVTIMDFLIARFGLSNDTSANSVWTRNLVPDSLHPIALSRVIHTTTHGSEILRDSR